HARDPGGQAWCIGSARPGLSPDALVTAVEALVRAAHPPVSVPCPAPRLVGGAWKLAAVSFDRRGAAVDERSQAVLADPERHVVRRDAEPRRRRVHGDAITPGGVTPRSLEGAAPRIQAAQHRFRKA